MTVDIGGAAGLRPLLRTLADLFKLAVDGADGALVRDEEGGFIQPTEPLEER